MAGHSPNAVGDSGGNPTELSLDSVYGLLSKERRRHTMACLPDHTEPIELIALAREVATRETGEPLTEVSNGELRDILISLSHTHLPKLAAAGVIEYDRDRNQVMGTADQLDRVLSLKAENEEEW